MKLKYFFTFCFLLSSQVFQLVAVADYIEPSLVKVSVRTYRPSSQALPLGRYVYDVSWQGIPVGQAGVEVYDKGDIYKVKAYARSAKVIDLFYELRHVSESEFSGRTFLPLKFVTQQTENRKFKKAEVRFESGGLIKSYVEKNGKKEDVKEFLTEDEIRDPISAAFLARSVEARVGEEFQFQIYNGKHRYLISFYVDGLEEIKVLGEKRQAYKITPKVQKLTDSEGEKRFRRGSIWMAADESKDILRMESEVLIGSVKAELKSFTGGAISEEKDDDISTARARLK